MADDLVGDDMVATLGLNPGALFEDVVSAMESGRKGWEAPEVEELEGAVPGVKFIELVASGGMGAVYRAQQERLDREVAVKLLPPEWLHSGARAGRFEEEGRLLGKLKHPHVVTVFESGRTVEGWPFLMMEYVEGGTLADRLQQPVSLREASRMVEEIAVAVKEAHEKEIVHRDLKPANVLLEGGGRVKVSDFGLAGLCGVATGEPLGSRYYSAPEQLTGESVGPRADVYSLGVMAAELLTGRRAGDGVHLLEVLGEGVPEPFTGVVLRAVSVDPARRQADAGVFLDEWHAARQARENRRKLSRTSRLAGAFAVMAALAGVGVVVARQKHAEADAARVAALRAEAQSRKTEAASLAAVVAEAATRGKVDEVADDLQRAHWLEPRDEVAGWLAGQFILDRMRLRPVARAAFSTGLLLARDFVKGHGVLYAVRQDDGVLCRGKVVGNGSGLQWVPWPDERKGCVQVEQSRDGALLAGLYNDGSLRLWDTEKGKERGAVAAHSAAEHSMCVSISGKLAVHVASSAAVEAASAVLRVISTEDGRVLRSFTLPHYMHREYLAVTFDDRWLVMGAAHQSWLGVMDLADGTLRDLTWLWEGWKLGGVGAVHRLCPLPDRPLVLLSGQCMGMRVACLDAEAGTMVWDQEVLGRPRKYTAAVEDIELVPGGEWFAVTGSEGDLMLHRLADGSPKGELMSCPVRGRSIEFIGEDLLVLSGGQRTTVWNWRTGARLTAPVARCLSPLGEGLFFEPGAAAVRLWRMEGTPARQQDFKLGKGKAAFDLSGDRRLGLFAVCGGSAELVDMESLKVVRTLSHHAPVEENPQRMVARPRLSADGSRAVTWMDERTLVVHNLQTPQDVPAVQMDCPEPVSCAAISPDGKRVALCLKSGVWEMRDATTGGRLFPRNDLCHPPPEHGTDQPGRGVSMEFCRDGAQIGIGTTDWTTVSLWNAGNGQPVMKPPFGCGHVVRTVRFGTDGVLWSGDWNGDCLRIVCPATYVSHPLSPALPIRPPTARIHAPVTDIALSEDGKWMAAASLNWSARIFDQAGLNQSGAGLEHSGEVTAVDWSPDAKRLLTASASGDVFIWDSTTGLAMFSWPQRQPVVQAGFALGGTRIVFAGMDGVVRVREVYGGGQTALELGRRLEGITGRKVGEDGQVEQAAGV